MDLTERGGEDERGEGKKLVGQCKEKELQKIKTPPTSVIIQRV